METEMEDKKTGMTPRQRASAVLHYEEVDRIPVVHFGYWKETLQKWVGEGHISQEQADGWECNGNVYDVEIGNKLGFDHNWNQIFFPVGFRRLNPLFEHKVVKEFPDGSRHVVNEEGVVILEKPGANSSIPCEIGYTLKDRASWEEHYKPRLQFSQEYVDEALVRKEDGQMIRFDAGGREFLQGDRTFHYGLFGGSVMGEIRDWLGLENFCYLNMDDPELFLEIVETSAELSYQSVKAVLDTGAKFDFMHIWEDLACKSGPLVSPALFEEIAGPHYKKISDLARQYGIDIIHLDSDGVVDSLIPTWINNGVNTLFPIEVGTWGGNIAPWREKYGKELRGVGGMRKAAFGEDFAAIDAEIERLKPLIALGGFIPCPDHHISPEAKWDNVRYYCDRMHELSI